MSDEIQAISQGNYILHNIDAKKLYVQEPLFTANSGDAVYVGWRPDETVLWSGNATVTATTGITANEPYTNFEKIKVYGRTTNDQAQRLYGEAIITSADRYIPFFLTYPAGNNDALRCGSFHFEITSTDRTLFIVDKGKLWNINNNSVSTGTFGGTITQIIGVNRKENA